MTIIGNSNTAITLSPANPNVTITGTITGDAPITINGTGGSYAIYTAVQGGPGASFDITNLGNIQGGGGGVGIVLAQPGIIDNGGVIDGAIGLLITGYNPGAYVKNTGLIDGFNTLGTGIGITGPAGVNNAGSVLSGKYAVFLYRGGNLTNTGLIDGGQEGAYLFDGGQIRNQGTIIGAGYAGLNVTQASGSATSLYNGATGRIAGAFYGVLLQGATTPETITNAGYIGAVYDRYGNHGALGTRVSGGRYDGVYLESGIVTNTGTITGQSNNGGGGNGIFVAAGAATIINKGLIASANPPQNLNAAIYLDAGGTIINQGMIAGRVQANGTSTIQNAGEITGPISGGAITVTNLKTGTLSEGVRLGQGLVTNTGLIDFGISTNGATINNTGLIRDNYNTGDLADGIYGAGGIITNTGTITGFTGGIDLITPGTVINRGVIKGYDTFGLGDGVDLAAGSTLYNAGLIASSDTTSVFFDRSFDQKNLLILAPTSTITGTVFLVGGLSLTAGDGTLNLASIEGLYELHFDAGSNWDLIGSLSPDTAIYNSSTLTNTAGTGLTLAAPVYNYGLISGSTDGVISAGAYLYNSGLIAGAKTGIDLTAPAYVINGGTIAGQTGVLLAAKSQFYNYAHARITGGLTATTNAELYNYVRATITAQNTAISLTSGAAYNSGFLAAANGIVLGTGTATNFGTITATGYAIDFTTDSTKNRLILAPTASTTGKINLDGGVLELQSVRHKTGTLAAAPANLSAITLDARANWVLAAPLTVPTLTNDGTLFNESGLTLTGPLTGRGTIVLDAGLTLAIAAAQQKIAFSHTAETLYLTTPKSFTATIENFTAGDSIALPNIPLADITGEKLAKNILTLTETTGTLTLTFSTLPAHDTFSLITDAAGTGIILAAPTAMSFAAQHAQRMAALPIPTYTAPAPLASPSFTALTTSGFLSLTQPATSALIPTLTLQP